jgi:molybdopterin biosynthesis enzyme MoaB
MIRKADGSQTLVVTLPGKPKAIFENLEILLRHGVLAHAVA